MALCYSRGRFLYEVRPDLFPEGMMTRDELTLWGYYYEELERESKRKQP